VLLRVRSSFSNEGGVSWSQFTRLHSLLDVLVVSSPARKMLADEFTRLASLICNVFNSPGLPRFLLPLLFPISNAQPVGGPSLSMRASIAVMPWSSYLIMIPFISLADHTGRCSRPINGAVPAKRYNMTIELAFFLRQLWHQIVKTPKLPKPPEVTHA
jgi:hypothetical protein